MIIKKPYLRSRRHERSCCTSASLARRRFLLVFMKAVAYSTKGIKPMPIPMMISISKKRSFRFGARSNFQCAIRSYNRAA